MSLCIRLLGFTTAWCERCLVFETSTRNIQKPGLDATGSKDSAPTLPATSSSPLKIGHPKRKRSTSNHPFSGAFAASFREGAVVFCFFVFSYFCLAGANGRDLRNPIFINEELWNREQFFRQVSFLCTSWGLERLFDRNTFWKLNHLRPKTPFWVRSQTLMKGIIW